MENRKLDKMYPEIKMLPTWVIYEPNDKVSGFHSEKMANDFYDKAINAQIWNRVDMGNHYEEIFIKSK